MKVKTSNLLLTVILIGAIHSTAKAQNTTNPSVVFASGQEINKTPNTSGEMRISGTIDLPEKLLHNFNRNFPSADNVKWTTSRKTFLANFISDEKTFATTFNKKGQFVHALIYGKEKDLPETIQSQLKKDFSSFTVFRVIEIKTPGNSYYQVILQNATQYMELSFSGEGKMQEMKKIIRADG